MKLTIALLLLASTAFAAGTDVTIVVGQPFVDPGATATDNYDGDITSRIVATSTVNNLVVGDYAVVYNVSDASGNAATPVTRVVRVVAAPGPTITLVGGSTVYLEVKTAWKDPGYSARSADGLDLTAQVVITTNLNNAAVGTYKLTYNVKDASGRPATPVIRTVIVRDTTKPNITLKSPGAAG